MPEVPSVVQSMPAGELVTWPAVPVRETARATDGLGVKVASTSVGPLIVTAQVSWLPVHAPDQPPKLEVELGAAVSVTCAPWKYRCLQSALQLIPPSALETEPPPAPGNLTVSASLATQVSDIVPPAP